VTPPADPVGSRLRALAQQLTPDDGPAATLLAAGLTRIADLAPEQRAPAATALLAQTARWYQQGQLSPPAYVDSINALTSAGGQLGPATSTKGHGHGHGEDQGN
jgi:hypothetical protein